MSPGFTRLFVHVVFSTKRQEPYLADPSLRSAVHAALAEACKDIDAVAVAVGGIEDHVHLLAGIPPELSVADFVRELKRESWSRIKREQPDFVRFHWQAGYGAFGVSASQTQAVERYIRSQPEHHRKASFRDEFRSLLERHEIAFDEATVWD